MDPNPNHPNPSPSPVCRAPNAEITADPVGREENHGRIERNRIGNSTRALGTMLIVPSHDATHSQRPKHAGLNCPLALDVTLRHLPVGRGSLNSRQPLAGRDALLATGGARATVMSVALCVPFSSVIALTKITDHYCLPGTPLDSSDQTRTIPHSRPPQNPNTPLFPSLFSPPTTFDFSIPTTNSLTFTFLCIQLFSSPSRVLVFIFTQNVLLHVLSSATTPSSRGSHALK